MPFNFKSTKNKQLNQILNYQNLSNKTINFLFELIVKQKKKTNSKMRHEIK